MAKPIDAFDVFEIERHEGRGCADRLDGIVELLEAADRACQGHRVRAGFRQGERSRIADPARGAGDERDSVGKGRGHARRFATSVRHARLFGACSLQIIPRTRSRPAPLGKIQLASASSDNCRGDESVALRSVSGVG